MGFEVIYYFKEKTEEGFSEEIQEKKIRIGKPYEDTPVEAVASKIMAQMARRNILIEDVEIFEFTRKKISFKQNDESILIKNKKYKFDDGPVCTETVGSELDMESDQMQELFKQFVAQQTNRMSIHQNSQVITPQRIGNNGKSITDPLPPQGQSMTVLKREYFDPELIEAHKAKSMGLKLTVGNEYRIVGTEGSGTTERYYVLDDQGQRVRADAMWFVPRKPQLAEINNGANVESINLWEGGDKYQDNMPSLR